MKKEFETDIAKIKSFVKDIPEVNGRRNFPETIKQEVIGLHYKSGMSFNQLENYLGITSSVMCKWKRRIGTEQTAFVHGKFIRHDVRTKALAVKDYIDNNISVSDLAKKFNCSPVTLYAWISKYGHNYSELIDAPDGIPYIVSENKMVYGDDNVAKIRQVLRDQYQTLMCMINSMHMTGDQAELMKMCAEESLKKEDALVKAASILEENGIDIKLK